MLKVTVRDEVSRIPVTMQLQGNRAALYVACDPCRRIDKIVDDRQAVIMRYAIAGRMLDSFGAMME